MGGPAGFPSRASVHWLEVGVSLLSVARPGGSVTHTPRQGREERADAECGVGRGRGRGGPATTQRRSALDIDRKSQNLSREKRRGDKDVCGLVPFNLQRGPSLFFLLATVP